MKRQSILSSKKYKGKSKFCENTQNLNKINKICFVSPVILLPNGVSFIKEIGKKHILRFIGFRKHVIHKLQ